MIAAIAAGISLAGGLALWPLGRRVMWRPRLLRRNYRNAELIGVGGVIVVVVALGVVLWLLAAQPGDVGGGSAAAAVVLVCGFGGLGLLDDLGAGSSGGGFSGHVKALVRDRRITTGLVKLVGGAVLAIGAAALLRWGGSGIGGVTGSEGSLFVPGAMLAVLRDGALIALFANLINLFDRAPARAAKVSAVSFALVVAAVASSEASSSGLVWGAAVLGVAAALVPFEIAEVHMLGDTGANVLGALVGLTIIDVAEPAATWMALAVVFALNVVSEHVSFSLVIDSIGPLRWLDRIGSRYR